MDKNQRDLLSCVNGVFTSYNESEYFEITGTYSKIGHRGYLTYLFEILIYELDYRVLSDSVHSSPGSKEFWKAQIRRKNFSIYRLNVKSNHKRKAYRFREEEIWGRQEKKVLISAVLISKMTAVMIMNLMDLTLLTVKRLIWKKF
ncbi:hypothetical protein [Flavobacterium sp. SORGH_AS_0622]|uniref:hypothetical protein n=1 Tax=Flavobacterium sp. SORGH_AS_0622 TaxID=3041772 RepID=UPI0027811423|nr:hypothetical protein [Flavobacterium sp. SORGH_AS_0622]MDQ1164625.1 hypothetical protein [Flavobacterium sp. SORGH_AS_0622]